MRAGGLGIFGRQGPRIRITSPAGGVTDKPVVMVEGAVSGVGAGFVLVKLRGSEKAALVRGGFFRTEASLAEGKNEITASVTEADGGSASDSVTVTYVPLPEEPLVPRDLTVKMVCPEDTPAPRLKCGWRPHPVDAKRGADNAPQFRQSPCAGGMTVSVDQAPAGIYTVGIEFDCGARPGEAEFHAAIYNYDPARKKTRDTGPLRLTGRGYRPAVRVLLPEGVFWEDDSWFSGKIENSASTTKYKWPEGLVWDEED